ncbi:MAG: DUF2254 domain-containing protein [Planctomycetes bacterium]|nr:DUF2254 domain-containing protein [Planctomycetota bacterium]
MARVRRLGVRFRHGLTRLLPVGGEYALLALGVAAVAAVLAVDLVGSHAGLFHHLGQIAHPDAATARAVIGNCSRVLGAVLALSISLVALAVPLTANIYTPRLIQLFISDRVVRGVLSLFVLSNFFAISTLAMVREGFVPTVAYLSLLVLAPVCLLAVIPFIAYVFRFLLPRQIIDRLSAATLGRMAAAAAGRAPPHQACLEVLGLVETQANMAQKSLERMDRVVTLDALQALKAILIQYVDLKPRLPGDWFVVLMRDMKGYTRETVAAVHRDRLIIEMHVYRQWELVMGASLGKIPDVSTTIASSAREVAEAQVAARDNAAIGLTVEFFNTLLRVAINRRDARGAYNVIYQYRLLAEFFCLADTDRAAQVAGHFAYYARLAGDVGLGFITEVAAHDLAYQVDRFVSAGLEARLVEVLATFPTPGSSARGVRCAQARAGAALLAAGREGAGPLVDLFTALPDRERHEVKEALLAEGPQWFWEITDRRQNLHYLPPEDRPHVEAFFARVAAGTSP